MMNWAFGNFLSNLFNSVFVNSIENVLIFSSETFICALCCPFCDFSILIPSDSPDIIWIDGVPLLSTVLNVISGFK